MTRYENHSNRGSAESDAIHPGEAGLVIAQSEA